MRSGSCCADAGRTSRRARRCAASTAVARTPGSPTSRVARIAANAEEIRAYEHEAAQHFRVIRRLSLPRNLLARAIELCVILDRAGRLEESGHSVRVATLFERAVTPRNISLFASRDSSRLPALRSS